MDDAERHASGAHYTAHDDIMRVVGPTIVEPWRKRIQAAGSLKDLTELRKELFAEIGSNDVDDRFALALLGRHHVECRRMRHAIAVVESSRVLVPSFFAAAS
jgi:hypothetical protein